jgi:hypothetical protein
MGQREISKCVSFIKHDVQRIDHSRIIQTPANTVATTAKSASQGVSPRATRMQRIANVIPTRTITSSCFHQSMLVPFSPVYALDGKLPRERNASISLDLRFCLLGIVLVEGKIDGRLVAFKYSIEYLPIYVPAPHQYSGPGPKAARIAKYFQQNLISL